MTAIPEPMHTIANSIDTYHEFMQEPPRPHMGCSLLGHHCERYLWLNFRWAVIEKFPGRVLRLFRRGQNEEQIVVDDLKNIGMKIRHTGVNDQKRVDFGSHVSGSIDGIIDYGISEAPNKKHILEIKTHSKKYFDDMLKKGVEKSKPTHYTQMQVYMLGENIDRALYVAVCKDDDRIYTERVKLDKKYAQEEVDKGKRLALSDRIPPPVTTDPTWYLCKFCSAHDFCHVSKTTKEVNCRTCLHSTAKEDSTWFCERWKSTIPVHAQRQGCDSHALHPDLVPWRIDDPVDEWTACYEKVPNGENGFKSGELIANFKACKNGDGFTNTLRNKFDARVTG